MGLDMSIIVRVHNIRKELDSVKIPGFDDTPVSSVDIEMARWRNHPSLHGFIVENFADSEDSCQDMPLSKYDVDQIIEAVRDKNLPHTVGFFFGGSDEFWSEPKQVNKTMKMLDGLKKVFNKEHLYLEVMYQARW